MNAIARAVVLAGLGASALAGCGITPAQEQAIRDAWAERDAERARECQQARGRFVAGGCVFGGQ